MQVLAAAGLEDLEACRSSRAAVPASSSACSSTSHRLLAVRADLAREALGEDEVDRGGDQERLDAHVEQAGDGRRGVVGVQRGEHQVAGERGLDRDLRGLEVADLADHDDVGVLPQEASAGPRRS